MTRVFKTLLLWLFMAVLPLQGMAAVVKASCGPAHHASGLAVTLAHDQHQNHASDDHRHHHGVAQHAATDDTASAADTVHTSSFCSACAACCVGAVAPPSALLWTPGAGGAETLLISHASLITGYVPGGLERPPRKISA